MQKGVFVVLLSVMAASPVLAASPKSSPYDQIPTAEDLAKFYPEKAMDYGKDGGATIRCTVQKDHSLAKCAIAKETPAGFGFGDAALQMSKLFRMKKASKPGAQVSIPIQFQAPG
jgi:protein TonB